MVRQSSLLGTGYRVLPKRQQDPEVSEGTCEKLRVPLQRCDAARGGGCVLWSILTQAVSGLD